MEDSRMPGNAETPPESGWRKCVSCSDDCCTCCTSVEWWRKYFSCSDDCCTCCTSVEWWRKYFSCSDDCCTCCPSPDENRALLANSGRPETTPQGTVTHQPSQPGNNGGSCGKTAESTANPPEPPETTETSEETQEKAPKRTKSNKVQPEETSSDLSFGSPFEDKLEQMRRAIKGKPLTQKVKVWICSRATASEYQWLKAKLESESFVRSVQPCSISNTGFQEFEDNVSRCDFGILYHSLNRGRLNITDVTDSLYDDELQYMSEKLGKKNVIVVIDDLKDSSDKRKEEILKEQPKLRSLATDVFLISGDEKKKK